MKKKESSQNKDKNEMIEDANRLSSLTEEMAKIYQDLKEGKKGEAEQKFNNILLEAEGFMSAIESLGKKSEFKEQVQDLGDWFNNFVKEVESRSETINKINEDYKNLKNKLEDLIRKLT
ncbi:MAG: hypothetical protein Tsb0015_00360 [Simkaniaceae bacterium]